MNHQQPTNGGAISRAVIYTRFSPRRNAEDCQSCAWQLDECRRYANGKGWAIAAAFNDPDVSGADAVRPTLWEAIAALKKGDVLLVWKWDRLARDLILALQIERAVEQRGASVVATTGDVPGNDPQAQFTRHILMAVAELERKMIKQRTSAAMRSLQRAGRRMSYRTPFGWVPDTADPSRLVEEPSEQAIRRRILDLHASGIGFRPIAKVLKDDGIVSRTGRPLSDVLVRHIVERG